MRSPSTSSGSLTRMTPRITMKIVNPIAKKGEELATNFLRKRGFKIIERNFRRGYGEIDIIAIDETEKEKVLTFIEVKTRSSNQFGSPLEAIAPWKLRSLVKTAQFYKMIHPNLPDNLRIDAVSVVLPHDKIESIDLVKNISGF